MSIDPNLQWHTFSDDELHDQCATSVEKGLDLLEVQRRQAEFGQNRLTISKGPNLLILFLHQFHQPLVYILLASAFITSFLQEWVDSGVIYGVVLVNAIIGFIQEAKAVKAIEALTHVLVSTATVVRDGVQQQVPADDLVPGDIVRLRPGDKVPADLRLISSRELQINESALTGESLPAQKLCAPLPVDTLLPDRTNMAYSSTLVINGTATGVVTATGDRTEIGRINQLIASADILATPLTRKLSRFSFILLNIILTLAAITFVIGIIRGESWLDMFMAAVALAVGAIPEGLPAAVTITLAIGVSRMAKRNVIIRKLPAVETLGSTTVICTDKTGTLTRNQMTVQEIYAGGLHFHLSGSGYGPEGTFSHDDSNILPAQHQALRECLSAGLLCNDTLLKQDAGGWLVEGDPTEAALVAAAHKGGLSREELAITLPRLDTIPFDSGHQFMATLHRHGSRQMVILKGSPESLLPLCTSALSDSGGPIPSDSDEYHRQAVQMAEKGLRVLAFARLERPYSPDALKYDDIVEGLTFIGLQGMIDPPRPEAVAAVRVCQSAGIQVRMITGDHAVTAAAVARQVGLQGKIDGSGRLATLTGRDLQAFSDAELAASIQHTVLFARVDSRFKVFLRDWKL